MGICHDHGTSTFAHNGYFLFCISARVEKVCFTTHSPATLEALLIWFSDYACSVGTCQQPKIAKLRLDPSPPFFWGVLLYEEVLKGGYLQIIHFRLGFSIITHPLEGTPIYGNLFKKLPCCSEIVADTLTYQYLPIEPVEFTS